MEFIYEKLDVWKSAVEFGIKAMKLAADNADVHNLKTILQGIEKCALSVSTAIAKGKGYPSKHDFAKHLYSSRGSVYETMTLLDILKQKQAISEEKYAEFEESGNKVAAMLGGLIKSIYKPKEEKENK
jgi:four helix bundle protein